VPEKRLLTHHILTAYHEIVSDPSARATFLMTKLAAVLYERGARIVLGAEPAPTYRDVHHSLDATQHLMWVSKDWAHVLGYRPHEAVGLPTTAFMAGDTVRFLKEVGWPTLLKEGKIGPVAVTYQTRQGELLPGTARVEVMRDETGAFLRTFCKTKLRLPLLHKLGERFSAVIPLCLTFGLLKALLLI